MGLHPGETVDSSRFFMNSTETRNFQDLFKEDRYVVLKNYLYNYILRKRAVKKSLLKEVPGLDIGSRKRNISFNNKLRSHGLF